MDFFEQSVGFYTIELRRSQARSVPLESESKALGGIDAAVAQRLLEQVQVAARGEGVAIADLNF